MKSINFKKYIPHIVGVLSFVIVSLVYFYPVLEGYKLIQGDLEKHKAMSHELSSHREKYDETALWAGNMFAGMPTYLTSKVKYEGDITKYILELAKAGLPHPASAIFAYLLGFFILLLCLRVNPWLAIVGAFAFAFSSYFLIIIEAGHYSKTYAIAFMAPILGGLIEALRGRLNVGVLLIAVFTALQLFVNHLQITYYLFFILLFVVVGEFIHAIKNGLMKSFSKKLGFIILGALLGVLPNIGNLLITYEYSKESTRGKTELTIEADGTSNKGDISAGLDKGYITQWSYGIDETFTLLVPNAKGGKSVPILGDEKEVERLRKEDPKFFNVLVNEYQKNQNAVLSYFGDQPIVSGPVYIGIVVILLAFLALLFLRSRFVIALAIVTALTVALSWGKNFMGLTEFFIDYVPGYNKFRAVAMILTVVEFTAPILAILFLDRLIKDREFFKENRNKLFVGIGAIALVLIGMAMSPDTFVDLSSKAENTKIQQLGANAGAAFQAQNQIESYRADVVSQSAWGSFRYLLGASVLLLLFIFGRIKKTILIAGIGGLILVDLWIVDKEYVNNEKSKGNASGSKYASWTKPIKNTIPFEPSAVDLAILNREIQLNPSLNQQIQSRIEQVRNETGERLDRRKIYELQYAELMEQTHYRVLNTNARLDQDVRTPYFHKTLGGYHGAKLKKYQEFIDFYLGVEHYQVGQAFVQAGSEYVKNMLPGLKYSNLLNVKYVIGRDRTGKSAELLVENPYANGNAWFVKQLKVVENADSSILALKNTDLEQVAVIEKSDATDIEKRTFAATSQNIKLLDYSPNSLEYEYTSTSDGFVVFSEIFYRPGWKAFINDKETDFTKVDYILRGMEVPAGNGKIKFVFEPSSFKIGQTLVWIASIVFLIFIIYTIYGLYKKEAIEQ